MKLTIKVLLLLAIFSSQQAYSQKRHTFEIRDGNFLYDSKPIQIHSGEMHYARIPREYWRHRLKMLHAMGLNAVATYVFWNYHNTAPGVWDFKTGNRNLTEFIKTAGEEGLFVILRPGPYACAEWDYGGYPWWLQKNKDLVIRSNNQPFLDSCSVYLSKLAEQVKDLQVTHGGPVIMVQAENEFGSYVSQRKDIPLEEHKKYNQAILALLKKSGFDVPFFTSDGSWLFEGGSLPGVLPAANGETNTGNLKKAVDQYHNGAGPYMVAEYYPGWLDHWGEPFNKLPAGEVTAQIQKYLEAGVSFNFYMAHGGTNFGFTSGANYNEEHHIQPDITSYDYDAPVSEAGWPTEKYMAVRELMKKYVKYPVPPVPARIPVISFPEITLNKASDVLDMLKTMPPVTASQPLTFEDLDQGSGYVLYSRTFNQPVSGKLSVKGLRDFGVVYINGKKAGVLNRQENKYELEVDIPFNGTLDILVENMGRINYGGEIVHNKKGIIGDVMVNDLVVSGGWKMYRMPFDNQLSIEKYPQKNMAGRPVILSGTFTLNKTGDTFLDMSNFEKGIVYVNGHHLGRYWNIGPQQTLYLPGCWLKKGKNTILVFEQLNDAVQPVIKTTEQPVLNALRNKTAQ